MKRKTPFLIKTACLFLLPIIAGILISVFEKEPEAKVIKSNKYVYNGTPYNLVDYRALDVFIGTMTGYGPDCDGCGGVTGCPPNQWVRDGNIYYNDRGYGKVRIVASDPSIPCGSIVRITASNLFKDPIIAIVLDRGVAIKGKKFDLLYESEAAASIVGFQRSVIYEVLRYGRK